MDECRKDLRDIGKLFSCVGILFPNDRVLGCSKDGKVKFRHWLPKVLVQSNIGVIVEVER